eukprot:Clim_evm11s243 gene=Clim_evmTU11s243
MPAEATKQTLPRRPMTVPEKILCQNAIGLKRPWVEPGEMICVKTQWTLACEITWMSMDKTYNDIGRPKIWRNDRFWLAIDHTVDPGNYHLEKQQKLIQKCEEIAEEAKLTDYNKPNETIIHTEFYRRRAQPGQMIVGADSHSCSTGGLGAFAIGLGAADVVMPLVTGETWIKVPETVKIEFTGEPAFGVTAKDVMLYTLGKLKCNTVAIERVVEWTGNIKALSCDARFAISNMTAEFGGIAGIFPPDEVTAAYISKRSDEEGFKSSGLYFKADEGAEYAATYEINMDEVVPQVALYPSPDNAVPVTDVTGGKMILDGVFIGACTTAEEDLILAAMVLEAGLKAGKTPISRGTRRVVPGSKKIVAKLERLGLDKAYKDAGFSIGAPGCSYCLAIGSDKAGEGETWLSSQNRNYTNRMGKGALGNLASAATVAASSFEMEVTDPRPLLEQIDRQLFESYLENTIKPEEMTVEYSEPQPELATSAVDTYGGTTEKIAGFDTDIKGRVQVFGDDVNTDAILPGEFLHMNDEEELGEVAFLYTNPDFRQKVKDGQNVIVAGKGFGCGSSREQAVTCLKGAGLKAIIAKNFGYIFSRNYKNFALIGIQVKDEKFYELATENADIVIHMRGRTVEVGGETFPFEMSLFEERLLAGGGVQPLFKKFGNRLFRVAVAGGDGDDDGCGNGEGNCSTNAAEVKAAAADW